MTSVDVIVPCYRYGHFLRQCVQSVLDQQGVDVRVLIIDDASPDDTLSVASEIVGRHPNVYVIRHEVNRGHIATYNEGLAWANADYLLVLSADDLLLPNALQAAARLMDAHPEVGFTFGKVVECEGDAGALAAASEAARRPQASPCVLDGLAFIKLSGARNIVGTPTAVIRTKLQKQVGGYRSELPHSGDMEMWLRLAAHGSVGRIDQFQAIYRRHDSNMSLSYRVDGWLPDILQRKQALDCFFEACGDRLRRPTRLRRRLFRQLACDALHHANIALKHGKTALANDLSDAARSLSPLSIVSKPQLKLILRRALPPLFPIASGHDPVSRTDD